MRHEPQALIHLLAALAVYVVGEGWVQATWPPARGWFGDELADGHPELLLDEGEDGLLVGAIGV